MKHKWRDTTTYSYKDKERIPRSFSIDGDHHLSIDVTRWINGEPEKWYLSCSKLGIKWQEMSNKEIDGAKHEALIYVARLFKVLAMAAQVMKEYAE
jgi:hypothetical protein